MSIGFLCPLSTKFTSHVNLFHSVVRGNEKLLLVLLALLPPLYVEQLASIAAIVVI